MMDDTEQTFQLIVGNPIGNAPEGKLRIKFPRLNKFEKIGGSEDSQIYAIKCGQYLFGIEKHKSSKNKFFFGVYKSDFKYARGLYYKDDDDQEPGEFSIRGAVDTSYISKHFCISWTTTIINESPIFTLRCYTDPGNKLELYETSIFYCLIIPGHPLNTELSALSEQGVGTFPITSGYEVHSIETTDQAKLTLSE
jgi:hypothetical protein